MLRKQIRKKSSSELCDYFSDSKLDTLKQYVKWTHIQMEKQNPNIDFDHYLLKGVFLNAGEGVKMQYAQEHWGDGQEAHATELYRMTPDERRNLPSENFVCERYLAKISSLVSISAARSNNFLKAERSWDDSMSDSNKKEKALNNSQTKLSSH